MWRQNLTSEEPVFISPESVPDQSASESNEQQSQQLSTARSTGRQVLDKRESSQPIKGKKPPTCLVVTMPNGDKIDHDSGMKTFAEVIEKLGITQVRRVYPSLLSTSESRTHGYKIGQYYIRHRTGTETKKRMLEKVAHGLEVRLKVEIVDKS